jgi:hypothetical protein
MYEHIWRFPVGHGTVGAFERFGTANRRWGICLNIIISVNYGPPRDKRDSFPDSSGALELEFSVTVHVKLANRLKSI